MSSSSDMLARRARLVRHDTTTGSALLPELTPVVRIKADEEPQRPDASYEAGFADGHASAVGEAVRAATAEADLVRHRAEELVRSLGDAMAVVRSRHEAELSAVASEVAEAALAIAEAIVGRTLPEGAEVTTAVTRALAPVPSGQPATIRVNPCDLAVVAGVERPDMRVVGDEAVPPGGCVVEAGASTIDGGLASAVDRARAVLLGTGDEPW